MIFSLAPYLNLIRFEDFHSFHSVHLFILSIVFHWLQFDLKFYEGDVLGKIKLERKKNNKNGTVRSILSKINYGRFRNRKTLVLHPHWLFHTHTRLIAGHWKRCSTGAERFLLVLQQGSGRDHEAQS